MNATPTASAALRSNADALWVQDHKAFDRYVNTPTEQVAVPEDMWDAPMAAYVSFHPVFGLAQLRMRRWEKIHAMAMAASERARPQPSLPGIDMNVHTYDHAEIL